MEEKKEKKKVEGSFLDIRDRLSGRKKKKVRGKLLSGDSVSEETHETEFRTGGFTYLQKWRGRKSEQREMKLITS